MQHIVATASAAGSVAVVDLKKQKHVMDLADNQGCAAHVWCGKDWKDQLAVQIVPTLVHGQ